jgi:hypothetical protein
MWIGIGAFLLAGGLLILRHRKGWGTPGAWMKRSDGTDADGTDADAKPPDATPEAQPG